MQEWGLFGNVDLGGARDIGLGNEVFGLTIPDFSFFGFQLMFAIITPALIAGAVAERMKFSAWVIFIAIWSIVVYAPLAHWVWGGGFIGGALGSTDIPSLQAIDFAGGLVVHINAGVAALALVLVLGPRLGWRREIIRPHSLPFTVLGAGILWFGWFGFNAGSALAADGLAVQALVNTHLAAAAAMLAWLVVERVVKGHATTLGAATGAVAGLVAITPSAGFVGGLAPIAIGLIAGVICYAAVNVKFRFGYDDSLDVIGVHLAGGMVGSLLVGFFADTAINSGGRDGVFFGGGWALFGEQLLAVGVTIVFSFTVTYLICLGLRALMPGGIRVSEEDEETGLDLTQHSEVGYALERV